MSAVPPPPSNGGSNTERLQRIEQKADDAKVTAAESAALARSAVATVESLRDVLVGNPAYAWDHGRIGRFEEKFDQFLAADAARLAAHKDTSRFRINNRLAALAVIVSAIVGLGSIIVTIIRYH